MSEATRPPGDADLTLQINLSAGDAGYAALTVPALVRAHPEAGRRLAVVDCCRQQRTRIFDPETRAPLAAFQERLGRVRALAEGFRRDGLFDEVVCLEPGDPRFGAFARKYARPWMAETHDYGGCGYQAYWAALELPRTRFILHYDADMLLRQDSGFSWVREARQLLPTQPRAIFALPRISPPGFAATPAEDAPSCHEGRPPTRVPGGWLNDWFSTRCFLLDRERLEPLLPLVRGRKIPEYFLRRLIDRGYPPGPEHLLFHQLGGHGWRTLNLDSEHAWLLHPTRKDAEYHRLLPGILAAVAAGRVPAAQQGYADLRLEAWAEFLAARTPRVKILLTADPEIPVPPTGYGGIERIVDALLRELRRRGHVVGLVAHPDSASPADRRFGWPGRRSGSAADAVRNAAALRRAVREFQPDLLHSFSRLAYLLPLLPSRLPKVMSYQRHTGGRGIAGMARLGGRSLRFTGCSEFICGQGRRAGGSWTAIPNFVELAKYDFVPVVPADAPLVFLSRIETIKGPDLAIAIARAGGRRLILAGSPAKEGPEREYWDRKVAPELGRNGIEWIGEVDDVRKNALLGGAAALLLPIQWDEPFGIVFAEALAAGTPVITCRRGALPEIIEEGATGFFISSPAEGVAAVARLAEIRRTDCRRTAEQRFSLPVCMEKYLSLYREMLAGPKG